MYLLKQSDIELIRVDISRQRVTYSHLLDDLVDHVCCDVEAEMDNGLSFKQAYEKVRTRIGANRFKKIQEETLVLIDKNYKSMKTFMKIFGVLSPTLLAMGALFKIQHWPGAGIMLVLGFFFLCFFFLPSAIYVLHAENKTDKKHLFMKLSGLFSSVLFLLGILFKVQHWPGAGITLTVGLALLGFVFLPSLIAAGLADDKGEGKRAAYLFGLVAGLFYIAGFLFKIMHWPGASIAILTGTILFSAVFIPLYVYAHHKNDIHVRGQFIFVMSASMMAVLFITMMALTVSKDVMKEFIGVEQQMDDVLDDLNTKNSLLVREIISSPSSHTEVASVHQKTDDLVSWISDLKKELVITTEPDNTIAISGDDIDTRMIRAIDTHDIPVEILIVNGRAEELADHVKEYLSYLISNTDDDELEGKLDKLFDFSNVWLADDYEITWEQATFEHRTFISNLNSLTVIQVKIRLAEKAFLQHFTKERNERQQIMAIETHQQ